MADIRVKFVSQKISKVRWRPSENQALPNSDVFASGSWDDEVNRICLWKLSLEPEDDTMDGTGLVDRGVQEARPVCEMPHVGDVTGLEFAGIDLLVVASSTGSVAVYKLHRNSKTIGKVHEWESLHQHPGEIHCPCTCVSTQGTDMAVCAGEDGKINILNLGSRKPVRVIDKADSCTINDVTFLKQLEVLSVNSSGQLKIFDLRQTDDDPARSLSVTGEQVPLHCVAKHPTQNHIVATGGQDGMLCIWDLRQDKFPVTLLEAHSSPMWEVKFHPISPDHLFTCSEDGSVWHWDASNIPQSAAGTGAGSGGGSVFTQHHQTSTPSIVSPWLSIDSGRNKMEITTLLPSQNLSVNTLDIESQTLICGTDEEALYTIDLPSIR